MSRKLPAPRIEPKCTRGHVIISVPASRPNAVEKARSWATEDYSCPYIGCPAPFDPASLPS